MSLRWVPKYLGKKTGTNAIKGPARAMLQTFGWITSSYIFGIRLAISHHCFQQLDDWSSRVWGEPDHVIVAAFCLLGVEAASAQKEPTKAMRLQEQMQTQSLFHEEFNMTSIFQCSKKTCCTVWRHAALLLICYCKICGTYVEKQLRLRRSFNFQELQEKLQMLQQQQQQLVGDAHWMCLDGRVWNVQVAKMATSTTLINNEFRGIWFWFW